MKIKPCKFCGKIPEVNVSYDKLNDIYSYYISCENDLMCDSDIFTSYYYIHDKNAKEDCIKDWNNQN